jgi:hypothetical protein
MSDDIYPRAAMQPGQPYASHGYPAQPYAPQPYQSAPRLQGGAQMAHPQAGMMQAAGYQPGYQPGYQAGYNPAGYHPAYAQAPMAAPAPAAAMQGRGYPTPAAQSSFFNLGNDRFLKGLLIGAAAAYLLTNENVQRTAIKGAVKLWGGLQGGVEEIKERFHDAEAELQASESHKDA